MLKKYLKRKRVFFLFLITIVFHAGSAYGQSEQTSVFPMDYTGPVYVVIKLSPEFIRIVNPLLRGKISVKGRILWGPHEGIFDIRTDEIGREAGRLYKPVAVKFEKKKKDQVPLTVIVDGHKKAEITFHTGIPDKEKYVVGNAKWKRR